MINLAPRIYRQTLLVEWLCPENITADQTRAYIDGLAGELRMTLVEAPKTSLSATYGESGWGHWEGTGGPPPLRDRHDPASANGHGELTESGIHFYAWDKGPLVPAPFAFGSAQIYTCRYFDTPVAVNYTRAFFGAAEIVWTDVSHGETPVPAGGPAWRRPGH